MKRMLKQLSTAVLLTAFAANIFALGGGTTNADFLKIGVGGRPSAMGEAFTAVADDANASFWNPAGMTAINRMSVSLMHLIWFYDTYYEYASFVLPIDVATTAAISANYFWIPAFDSTANTDSIIPVLGTDPASYDLAVTGSVARNFGNIYTKDFTIGNISLGGNFSYIKRSIMGFDLTPVILFDLGLMANITEDMKFGLAAKGMGTSSKDDQAPLSVNMGLSYNIKATDDFTVLLAGDLLKPIDATNGSYKIWKSNLGLELSIYKIFALRAGYKFGNEFESFTAGAGVGMPDLGSIDYAFMPNKALGSTHRISLTASFGNAIPKPMIGAPRPPQKVSAIAGDKIVSIGWEPNPEGNISGYNIYYKESVDGKFKKLNKEPLLEETKFRVSLQNERAYYFAVTAINNRNLESIKSEEVSATPQKFVSTKPARLTGMFTKVEGNSITVMWDAPADSAVAGYNLYFKKAQGGEFKRLNKNMLKENKATLAGLQAGTEYYFAATAINKEGTESDISEEVVGAIEKAKEDKEYF